MLRHVKSWLESNSNPFVHGLSKISSPAARPEIFFFINFETNIRDHRIFREEEFKMSLLKLILEILI
ncbi:hypothetical protein BpHYR1_006654 [Brachionus plicatilis]|uniref:Uncharacterized protein n=1 Tax=Brachionus plicatilis TaxID=10195 RepID=A0A3M7R234_BRAPC|nr:hypothetical protein BpHYR1_006654 [Brachionus plicatilis]